MSVVIIGRLSGTRVPNWVMTGTSTLGPAVRPTRPLVNSTAQPRLPAEHDPFLEDEDDDICL